MPPLLSSSSLPLAYNSQYNNVTSSKPSSLSLRTNLYFSTISKTHSSSLSSTLRLFHLLPFRDTVTFNTAISACLLHSQPLTSLRLFLCLLNSGFHPDSVTFRLVLKAVGEVKEEGRGLVRQVHAWLVKLRGLEKEEEREEGVVLGTKLIGVYLMFGLVRDAVKVFDGMLYKDEMVYGVIMARLNKAGSFVEVLKVFDEMIRQEEEDNVEINPYLYSSVLNACSCGSNFEMGKQIHAHVIKSGFQSDSFVGTGLVDLYARNGNINCSKIAFFDISQPNVISWNKFLSRDFSGTESIELFSLMRESGIVPDKITFGTVFQSLKDPNLSPFVIKQLQGLAVKMILDPFSDVFISSALFDAYIKKDCFSEAKNVVAQMKENDDATYNIIIQGYISNFHQNEAVYMLLEGLKQNKVIREVTLNMILTSLEFNRGIELHGLLIKFGYDYFITSLIRFYIKHKHINEAIILFNHINIPDIVDYTSLISGLSQINESRLSLKIYTKMLYDELVGPTNEYLFPILLSSCADVAVIEEGKQIHAQILKSGSEINFNNFVINGLIQMYAKCGYINEAHKLFDEMPKRDLACYNAMISAFSQHGSALNAIQLFNEMINEKDVNINPDEITFIGVLSACSRAGLVEKGYRYFNYINNPTINHYACLIDMLGRAGRFTEAIGILTKMPFSPNENIYSSLLAASCSYKNIELGEYCAKELFKLNKKDPGNYIALSNLYASVKEWDKMREIRKLMRFEAGKKERGVSWISRGNEGNVIFASEKNWYVDNKK